MRDLTAMLAARDGLGGGGGIHQITSTTGTDTYVAFNPNIEQYMTPALIEDGEGLVIAIRFSAANITGAVTLNINNMGARLILDADGVGLRQNAIRAHSDHILVDTGTEFRLVSAQGILTANQMSTTASQFPLGSMPRGVANTFLGGMGTATNPAFRTAQQTYDSVTASVGTLPAEGATHNQAIGNNQPLNTNLRRLQQQITNNNRFVMGGWALPTSATMALTITHAQLFSPIFLTNTVAIVSVSGNNTSSSVFISNRTNTSITVESHTGLIFSGDVIRGSLSTHVGISWAIYMAT